MSAAWVVSQAWQVELSAARLAGRQHEVELLLEKRARLLEKEVKQLQMQLLAARRGLLSDGAHLSRVAKAEGCSRLHATDPPWQNSRWFSHALADVGLRTPWEQWGLFASAVGGCTHAARQFFRAHHVRKFVETDNVEHLYMANVPTTQASRARFLVTRFRVQGAAVAALSPLLWLAWRT